MLASNGGGQILGGLDNSVRGGHSGDGEGMVFEFPGVSCPDGTRFKDTFDTSTVIEGGCKYLALRA